MYFALMDVVKFIPLTVFSAILISVAINMSRFRLFAKLTAFGVRDVIILIVTCALTVAFDLTYGVIGGVIVTFIVNAKNLFIGLKISEIEADQPTIKASGTLYFINADKLISAMAKIFEQSDKVIVDMTDLKRIDETAMEKLVVFNKKIKAQGKDIDLINYNDKIAKRFDKYFKVF